MGAATVRPLEERDVDRAGDVNFVAFYDVAVRHGMRPVVTTPSEARSYLRHLLAFDPPAAGNGCLPVPPAHCDQRPIRFSS